MMRKVIKRTVLSLSMILVILTVLSLPSYVLLPQDDNVDKNNYTIVIPYRIDGRNTSGSERNIQDIYLFKLVSHRGYSAEAPENTLPAFRLSKKKGYNYVETDIQFTKDGVAVCLHDKFINRTARYKDGSKINKIISISDITYMQALKYDFGLWKSEEYKNTQIPTFEQFIKLCRDLDLCPYIELKANAYYTDAQMKYIADIVSAYDMDNKVTFICFSYYYLKKIGSLCSTSRLGLLYNKKIPLSYGSLLELKTEKNEVFIDSRLDCANEIADTCRNYNIPLEVWVLDTEKSFDELDPYISGGTTNRLRIIYENGA